MANFSHSVRVRAPAARVFHAISDFPNAPKLIKGITKIEMLTDGPTRVGTTFRETRMMFGREATETMEVSRLEPGRAYELTCMSCGCRYVSEMRAQPVGDETDLSLSFQATPLTFVAKVMGFVMRPLFRSMCKAISNDLVEMKAEIERREAATG